MREVDLLWQLQNLDSELAKLEKLIDAAEKKEKLIHIKQKFEQEKELLDRNQALLKEKVKVLKSNRIKAEELKYNYKKTEDKLYGGTVSNVKQLEGLQKNLGEMEKSIATLEKEGKELEEQKKGLEEEIKKGKVKLLKYKNSFDTLKKEYLSCSEKARQKYEELMAERKRLLDRIDKNVLKKYNRIRLGADPAVVEVNNERCGGCHMELSVLCMQRLREGNLVVCETCGRILYQRES